MQPDRCFQGIPAFPVRWETLATAEHYTKRTESHNQMVSSKLAVTGLLGTHSINAERARNGGHTDEKEKEDMPRAVGTVSSRGTITSKF